MPVINCTGGTEVGACFLSPTPVGPIKACSVGGPALGMAMDVVDDTGNSLVGTGEVGELVCRRPFPGMTRGFWRDPDKFIETYWSRIPGVWVHGDWASVDADGFWFLHGRSDDTLNIAGKRIGPAELESAAVGHPAVREAAAIGVPHEVKGETAWIFVLPAARARRRRERATSSAHVAAELGKAFKPDRIFFVDALPKTRSAKIVRRAVQGDGARRRPRRPLVAREPRVARRDRGGRRLERSRSSPAAAAGSARTSPARSPATAGRSSSPRARATQIDAVAAEIGGRALELDVSSARAVERVFAEVGDVDLLVANAGVRRPRPARRGSSRPDDWWRTFEVNVLGVAPLLPRGDPAHARARRGPHRDHRQRRVVPARLPTTAYSASKAAVGRYAETLHNELDGRIPVFVFQPRASCSTEMTASVPRRRAVDAAGARTRARPQARDGPLRRARGPLPARGARRRRRPARADRRGPRARPERDPTAALKTLVCFGDSNTWGYVPGSDGERFPREQRWPVILQRLLGDDWDVISEGLGGRTATIDRPDSEGRNGLPYLLPCLLSHAPVDVVVVFLGTNDVNYLADDRIARCIARLVDSCGGATPSRSSCARRPSTGTTSRRRSDWSSTAT